MDQRGTAARGTAHRLAAPTPRELADYPRFNIETLGLRHAEAIPDALAYALKWQREFQAAAGNPTAAKEIADNLLALLRFLKQMEESSPHDADGALLVNDPLAQMSRAKSKTRVVEMATGESILVTDEYVDAPMPAWAPSLFPPDFPFDLRAHYPARPRWLEEIPPFGIDNIRQWILTSALAPFAAASPDPVEAEDQAVEAGVEEKVWELRDPESKFKPHPDEAEKAMEAAARKIDRSKWTAVRLANFKGVTPTVNAAIARLATTTLADIQRHTGVKFPTPYADDPLIKHTAVILYHSVCSFALDGNGEPFALDGLVDYPILIDKPGDTVRRDVPSDIGVTISVQKYGFGLFRLSDQGIQKLLAGTVGAFTEELNTFSWPSDVHKAVDTYMQRQGSFSFIAGVTARAAYDRAEITLARIRDRIPEFVDVVTPYVVREILARARAKLDNWEAFAKEVLIEVIKEIVLDKVKDKIRDYLVKKIGKRIIPGVNAAMAVYDLAAGGEERMRIRTIIACIMVALESRADEDMHIAGKTCSKVLGDEFEDAVIDALIEKSKKTGAKLRRRGRGKDDAVDHPEPRPAPDQPSAQGKDKPAEAATETAAPTRVNAGNQPIDVPVSDKSAARPSGAQSAEAASKQDKAPRPPNQQERAQMAKWPETERRHKEHVADKAAKAEEKARAKLKEQQDKEEAQKQVVNGDPGTSDQSKDQKSKGTEKKATGDNGTGSGAADAKPGGTGGGTGTGNTGATANNKSTGATGARRRIRYPENKDWEPMGETRPPDTPPGTRDNPRVIPPVKTEPTPDPMVVKEPAGVPETQDVRTQLNPPSRAVSASKALNAESAAVHGPKPPQHDSHHITPDKDDPDGAGGRARDALETAGVKSSDAANEARARGQPKDPRLPFESSSQHWSLHKKEDYEALAADLESVKHDPAAVRDVLRKYGLEIWEGRRHEPLPIQWGPDPEPPDLDDDDDDPKKPRGGRGRRRKK